MSIELIIRASSIGRKHSEETKFKIKMANTGKPKSEAHKLALRKPKRLKAL